MSARVYNFYLCYLLQKREHTSFTHEENENVFVENLLAIKRNSELISLGIRIEFSTAVKYSFH